MRGLLAGRSTKEVILWAGSEAPVPADIENCEAIGDAVLHERLGNDRLVRGLLAGRSTKEVILWAGSEAKEVLCQIPQ